MCFSLKTHTHANVSRARFSSLFCDFLHLCLVKRAEQRGSPFTEALPFYIYFHTPHCNPYVRVQLRGHVSSYEINASGDGPFYDSICLHVVINV